MGDARHYATLCDQPTGLRPVGAMVVTGDIEKPDGQVVCWTWVALPAETQKARRDRAMARMLRTGATAQRPEKGD